MLKEIKLHKKQVSKEIKVQKKYITLKLNKEKKKMAHLIVESIDDHFFLLDIIYKCVKQILL